jgi:hypothetical protein
VKLGRDGYPTGIVVRGEFDPATPYEGGPAMAGKLGNRLITVRDEGGHVLYGSNPCVEAAVDDYLTDGVLPQPGASCAGTPRPDVAADSAPGAGSGSPTGHGSLEAQVRTHLLLTGKRA